jgi:hypothetical protein
VGNSADDPQSAELVPLHELSRKLAEEYLPKKDWAGLPVPIPGLQLVLEPRYRHKALENFRWKSYFTGDGEEEVLETDPPPEKETPGKWRLVNSWWNEKFSAEVLIFWNEESRVRYGLRPKSSLEFTMNTLQASIAWPVEAEKKALDKLSTFIAPEIFDQYFLAGHFSEQSKRSKLVYLFRKGKPTITLREEDGGLRPLCTLCLHPIGYYADTWAGVTCPTDEVIAHLLMMRGAEEKFWAQANQHPINHPASGV